MDDWMCDCDQCNNRALPPEYEEEKMTEPARVTKVPSNAFSVEIPKYDSLTSLLVNGVELKDYVENVSFRSRTIKLHKFGSTMYVDHAAYYEMGQQYLDMEYERFYNGMVDNCKDLFIQDPVFKIHYDAMRHQDIVSWSVLAGSEQIDFFKELFTAPPEIREVEKKVYVVELPHTIRECLRQAWTIFKKKFRRK